ncbi:UNVERIFIED_CONTAM: hypothetical protein Sangu_1113000 [Sesamum angustifolium]|uniref:CRAL-TRIO domain-containing protein n=1 Tax=Sesamum angustifolium TaxID=2727405 RepID=A0AAW2P137_9LAMI
MGKKDHQVQKEKDRVQSVLQLLKKQAPLTVKQEKYCNSACVERFLKAKGDSAKKAAKQLRNCLAWRDSIGTDNLIADEFSAELAEGVAYVAGHDDELRPVMIFRIKQDYQKFHSQKLFTRLLVFTLEVAIQTMAKNVEQFVLLFDASFFRSASAFMNMLLATLKIIADYYPGRLHKAFVIDPPSLFSYLWKGMKPFVELSPLTMVVSSLDYEESLEFNDLTLYPRAASLRFDSSSVSVPSSAKLGSCSSSRFSFTVSHHFDSLKPWYLSFTDTSASKVGPTNPSQAFSGPAISPLNARSYSLHHRWPERHATTLMSSERGSFHRRQCHKRPKSWMHPWSTIQELQSHHSSGLQPSSSEGITPVKSKMRPPLGGLISIVSPQLRRRHMSISQRF